MNDSMVGDKRQDCRLIAFAARIRGDVEGRKRNRRSVAQSSEENREKVDERKKNGKRENEMIAALYNEYWKII